MAFSYQYGANSQIDYVRLLISDTQAANHVFEDAEIVMAYNIQASQFQSSQLWSGAQGAYLPSSPVSYLRVAALLLDSIASNRSRLAAITRILDVELSPEVASKSLRDQAKAYRETDDDAGAFFIIEQVNDQWSFRDRFWKQVQRQTGN